MAADLTSTGQGQNSVRLVVWAGMQTMAVYPTLTGMGYWFA
jgi:hypothetical protein